MEKMMSVTIFKIDEGLARLICDVKADKLETIAALSDAFESCLQCENEAGIMAFEILFSTIETVKVRMGDRFTFGRTVHNPKNK